jgi:predicted type IV restriction endonuclease
MVAPKEVLKLVENFERNLDAYRNGKYNETQVRREFIDPMFKALGWDIDNTQGYAEAYKDVIHEDAIKVGISTKAPDYSFRIGGQRKFFLEAKKPSVNVKDDIEPAFQLRRYAWSAKLPLSIVTDFEEFAIYDCRQKPDKNDKASKARLFYCTFHDYAEKWDEIAAIFSKDAINKGSFDKYATTSKGKRGTAEVDSAFLEEIENWRNLLAHNIALRNDGLSQRELNFAVQQTIDRIIFLRICEDRGIEPYGKLMALQNGVNVYSRLRVMFHDADDRYNSGLFHFKHEKGRAVEPDELTLHLEIDDKVLKEIFKHLYYPDCPYEFSVLGADILGQVYEQFLGKVIRLTSGNRAVVEDKPEVKKAGGVYYTPSYIVDYIVQHTVGKLLEGKAVKQAAGLSILDPACGSGSFLIGAYQYLLDWYLARYLEDAEKFSKGKAARIRPGAQSTWRLSTAEKKRILLEHIYGVDIDAQAVEVTNLSLLLKMLEGESDESVNSQMKLFHERVLPDLERNIQCGNSLIGPDFYDGQLDLDDETAQRINVFDWQAAFPQVFKAGGFDAVIGNPPYVRPHNIPEETKKHLWKAYRTFVAKSDLYSCFMERAMSLTKIGGLLSFIVPQTWTSLESFTNIRIYLLGMSLIRMLTQLPKKVFKNATVETCVFLVERSNDVEAKTTNEILVEALDEKSSKFVRCFLQASIQKEHLCNFQLFGANSNEELFAKIKQVSRPLGEYVSFAYGFKTADDGKFIHTEKLHKESRAFIRSGALKRYWHEPPSEFVWYVPDLMIQNRKTARPGEAARFEAEKIIVSRMGKGLAATFDPGGLYVKDAMMLLARPNSQTSLQFLLGIINSKLLGYFYQHLFITIDVLKNALLNLPIVTLEEGKGDRTHFSQTVALVEKMLALHQQLAAAKTPHDATLLQRQIEVTDKQIDQLVYQLYGLSEEEIALVEGAQ